MKAKTIVKTVRFNQAEHRHIEQFLRQNPALGFSALVKLSIDAFLKKPELKVPLRARKPEDQVWN